MNPLKRYLIPLLAAFAAGAGTLHAQTINWGSAVFSDLVDSKGNTLDNTFIFELGSFVNNFTPNQINTADWLANWQAFDVAGYNGIEAPLDDGIYGYLGSAVQMTSSGTSNSAGLTPGAISFEGLDAYMWVRNSNVAEPGSEWLLVRANAWVFPAANPDCCGNELPIEWSTSDLSASNIPEWGTQGGITGGGKITNTGVFTLQTATFVPEPTVPVLNAIAALAMVLRRRRSS